MVILAISSTMTQIAISSPNLQSKFTTAIKGHDNNNINNNNNNVDNDNAEDPEENQEMDSELDEEHMSETKKITRCIYTNDPDRLKMCLEGAVTLGQDEVNALLNKRDAAGKSPLDITAILGRTELLHLLINSGANINSITSKGYSCLHHGAAWGHLEVLKVLVESGGILHQKNIHDETPREIAVRYKHSDCAEYLEAAEEKETLLSEISQTLSKLQEMDKSLVGKITKDEKNLVINTCKVKQEWLKNSSSSLASDIRTQLKELTDVVQPVMAKLSDPAATADGKKLVK